MFRIVVFEINGKWTFSPGARPGQSWNSVLDAANAALEHGEAQRGEALGYVVRLLHDCGNEVDGHNVVLHTHTFAGAASRDHSVHSREIGAEKPGLAHADLDGTA